MQSTFVSSKARSVLVVAGLAAASLLAGCADTPRATIPASGVTSSNGGGMRTTGAIPDVSVSNGQAQVGTMSTNPRVPRY